MIAKKIKPQSFAQSATKMEITKDIKYTLPRHIMDAVIVVTSKLGIKKDFAKCTQEYKNK